MQVAHSRNLFIDSSSGAGRGDDFQVELGANHISCMDGQHLRLTLVNFSMYNQLYTVNASNNRYTVVTTPVSSSAATITTSSFIPSKNYKTCGEIAAVFAEQVRLQVQSDVRTVTGDNSITCSLAGISSADVTPSASEVFGSTGDRMLGFSITCSAPHTLQSVKIELKESEGELWHLLGGNRLKDTDIGHNSFILTMSSTEVIMSSYYPMARSSNSQVYLRCNLPNDNIETASLNHVGDSNADSTLSSNIIGLFQMDFEYIHYDSDFSI